VGFPSQEGLTGQLTFNRFEDNFNPALGFANRTGVDETGASVNYTLRPDNSPFQALNFGVDFERFDDSAGNLQSESLSVTPLELTTTIGDGMFLRSNFNKEQLVVPFRIHPGVVIPAGRYDFENHGIEFRSASFRKLSGRLAWIDGTFYGGHQSRLFGNLSWQPSPKIRTNLGFNVTDVELPEGDFMTRLVTASIDYVFSNTLSWVNLVQYDNVSETLGINMRLQWIPRAGQEYFFVVNHNMEDLDRDNRFQSAVSTVTAKFSYTFRY
jgi:hypothetical protein